MAQLQSNLNNSSSSSRRRSGEDAARQANVLASCYIIDAAAAQLKGLHYCTTPLAGAECPPLAAITATNELTVFPKKRSSSDNGGNNTPSRRGGATLRIREECERLFCETMKTVFLGERNMAGNGSGLTSVYDNNDNYNNYDDNYDNMTPAADDEPGSGSGSGLGPGPGSRRFAALSRTSSVSDGSRSSFGSGSLGASSYTTTASIGASASASASAGNMPRYAVPAAWLELWDFVGCGSFRGFLAEDPETGGQATSLFAFFDASVLSRDLKRALMALIELADTALGCAHLVICVDRGGADALPDEASSLLKGLQWAGFSLTTLDTWTGGAGVDVTSPQWIFMGMEL